MKKDYRIGERIEFMARNRCSFNGNRISGKLTHFVGYVKQIRRSFFGRRYVVIVSRSSDLYIIPYRDIIGSLENPNKT